jgi:hypothetical protein
VNHDMRQSLRSLVAFAPIFDDNSSSSFNWLEHI